MVRVLRKFVRRASALRRNRSSTLSCIKIALPPDPLHSHLLLSSISTPPASPRAHRHCRALRVVSVHDRARHPDDSRDALAPSGELRDQPSRIHRATRLPTPDGNHGGHRRSRYLFVLTAELTGQRREHAVGVEGTPKWERCEMQRHGPQNTAIAPDAPRNRRTVSSTQRLPRRGLARQRKVARRLWHAPRSEA